VQTSPEAARLQRLLVAEVDLAAGHPQSGSCPWGRSGPELLRRPGPVGAGGAEAADQAAQALQTWVSLHPPTAAPGSGWPAWGAAGKPLRALRAEAEVQVARFDYSGAMDRFKAAQDLARRGGAAGGDHVEASIIDARTREVASLLREQAAQR
jgi:hypothetical protein